MTRAVFLDRDGTINKLILRRSNPKQVAPWKYAEFEYIDGVKEAVDIIKRIGYTTHIVTNQPDVDDGLMTVETLNLINDTMKVDLRVDTIQSARTRNTPDYKPNPGMLENIINQFKVTRSRSWMIGDSWKDIVAGHNAKVRTIYLGDKYECPDEYKSITPDYVCKDLLDAAKFIERVNKEPTLFETVIGETLQ